jgi:benzodiazapine receptor
MMPTPSAHRSPRAYRRDPHLDDEAEWGEARSRLGGVAAFGVFSGLTAAAAIVGARVSGGAEDEWYAGLDKPSFTPPPLVFPVAWTGIYALFALSGYMVWRAPKSRRRRRALWLWGASLALNAAWSPLFFGLRRPGSALVDLAALGVATGAYTLAARRVDRRASRMTLPYLGWLAFAAVLNEEVWRRNR